MEAGVPPLLRELDALAFQAIAAAQGPVLRQGVLVVAIDQVPSMSKVIVSGMGAFAEVTMALWEASGDPVGWPSSRVSVSGPAGSSPGHRSHCRVGPVEQPRRTGVTTVGGEGEAMDQEPRQRQRDGHQQPSPQPGGQENPHIHSPFFWAVCSCAEPRAPQLLPARTVLTRIGSPAE